MNLTGMIRELEDQLDRMISANEALKQDLDDERRRRLALEQVVEDLREDLSRAESEAAGKESVIAELEHLSHERSRMAAQLRDLEERLGRADHDGRAQGALVERLKAARGDALEEVESVEAQFERAMQMVAEARAQLTIALEERDALEGRLELSDRKLAETTGERDALLSEVDQSRAALDDIRRSLTDVVMVSADALADDAPPGGEEDGVVRSLGREPGGR